MTDLTPVGNPEINAELARRVAAANPVEEPPPPLPPPEIPWRLATDLEIASCRSAKSVLAKAHAAGYRTRALFARGPYIGADGQPLDTADALMVGFVWARQPMAHAIWWRRKDKWEFGSAYTIHPTVELGGNDLGHWLCGTEPKKKEAA